MMLSRSDSWSCGVALYACSSLSLRVARSSPLERLVDLRSLLASVSAASPARRVDSAPRARAVSPPSERLTRCLVDGFVNASVDFRNSIESRRTTWERGVRKEHMWWREGAPEVGEGEGACGGGGRRHLWRVLERSIGRLVDGIRRAAERIDDNLHAYT